ncbi:MAG: hypothetical protein WD208_12695 [Dehalococcoidia bacterium]
MNRFSPASVIIVLVMVFAVAAIMVGNTWAAEPSPAELLPTPEPPEDAKGPLSKPTTPEEVAVEEARYAADLSRRGGRVAASGPETAGSTIELRDRVLTLPEDAYIEMYTVHVVCIEGHSCPETPLHMIRRGNSRVEIDYSGEILFEELAPGKESEFDWLKEVLR